jgi:Ig-like domain from next to BRCA1 gene
MPKGPLAATWDGLDLPEQQAGAVSVARVRVRNDGTVPWRSGIFLAYHWLDDRGNPIVWDGVRTTPPALAPGESATVEARVRAPLPPGRYRLAFDLVAEGRAWFSELGGSELTRDVQVEPRPGEPNADLPEGVEPAADWAERVRASHAEGFAVVAGAVDWVGGSLKRRPRALDAYLPGKGRVPGFASPLLCPSVLPGVEIERIGDVEGIPAYAAPREEPWVYDGRIVLRIKRS